MKKTLLSYFIAVTALCAFIGAALHVTAGERRQANSQTYGTSATDKVGFHGATPIPMASAAAQATVVPVASATVSPTAIPTITPTFTPVGSSLDPAIAQINLLTAKVNQLVADNVALTALTNRLQKDLKDKGLIKGGP